MSQFLRLWTSLPRRRQFIAGAAALGVFLGILTMARTTIGSETALLYSGLEPAAAGEVLTALDTLGIEYDVRSGAIHVPAAARDRLRMQLAGQGLPANGAAGYELLDGLTGFGTTAQMFDAAYWRAKEGELARTISAQPGFRSARVHIAHSTPRPFQNGQDSSASVTVIPHGGGITGEQARALRYLVASAAAGLLPDAVTVIDGRTGTLIESGENGAGRASERAALLRQNILRLVEARVGVGNAVVEVNVEEVLDRETIVERRFDPSGRVAVSTDSSERSRNSTGGDTGGTVSVSSNLPDGDAVSGGNGSGRRSNDTETRESVSFEVSETKREVLRSPAAVKRITVAVLVDGTFDEGADGTPVFREREPREMDALRDLVSSAIGFDEARGDTVTIRSMALDKIGLDDAAATPPPESIWSGIDTMKLIQLAVLATVTLALGLFLLRPLLRTAPYEPALPAPADQALGGDPLAFAPGSGELSLSHRPDAVATNRILLDQSADSGLVVASQAPARALDAPDMTDRLSKAGEAAQDRESGGADPQRGGVEAGHDSATAEAVDRLRALISDRKLEAVEVLRGWIEEPMDKEGETV